MRQNNQGRRSGKDRIDRMTLMMGYVNSREFFWIKELRELLGCVGISNSSDARNSDISRFISKLSKEEVIMCSEVKMGQRQYYKTRVIIFDDLKLNV